MPVLDAQGDELEAPYSVPPAAGETDAEVAGHGGAERLLDAGQRLLIDGWAAVTRAPVPGQTLHRRMIRLQARVR